MCAVKMPMAETHYVTVSVVDGRELDVRADSVTVVFALKPKWQVFFFMKRLPSCRRQRSLASFPAAAAAKQAEKPERNLCLYRCRRRRRHCCDHPFATAKTCRYPNPIIITPPCPIRPQRPRPLIRLITWSMFRQVPLLIIRRKHRPVRMHLILAGISSHSTSRFARLPSWFRLSYSTSASRTCSQRSCIYGCLSWFSTIQSSVSLRTFLL